MRRDLPLGTVTFLFTDIEGSTRLLHELGDSAYANALAEHRRIIRQACTARGGVEVDTQGDAFFYAFPTAPGAVEAARAFTEDLQRGPIRVRVGLHTGTPLVTDEGYVGSDVHRAARIGAAGHGGQVLLAGSTASLVEAELRDLGEHRFKGLSHPERVYQLTPGDFPPLKSLFHVDLPVPANPLVGRDSEREDVVRLLTDDGARIVTLTGPGGVGKTRFAVEVAGASSGAFPDGVWFVPLSALRSVDLVLPTIAGALGVEGDLARHIGNGQCLIVLDNLEQVIDAAGQIAALAASCPQLRILATSREALRVAAEHEVPLGPLSRPSSVELFRQRAAAAAPDVELDGATVGAICARLDGLPLAIELAAVRTKALSPAQLLDRLSAHLDLLKGGRDADPRHATLRATIDWSYQLLSPHEQHLFVGLGAFVGGCTLRAAEDVCGADIDVLQSLVDQSLLRFRGERFWMLETIHVYADERLEGAADGALLRRRHAEWFTAFVERAEPELDGNAQGRWLDALAADHDNVRAALRWATGAGDATLALRLAGASGTFWWVRGHATEGRRWLDAALEVPGDAPPGLRARALGEAAHLAHRQGDAATARRLADESIRLAERSGSTERLARTLRILALVAAGEGDTDRFRSLAEQSADAARASSDDWALVMALNNLGCIALDELELDEARALLGEASTLARSRGDERGESFVLENLALAQLAAGDAAGARGSLARSLVLAHRLGFVEVVAMDLLGGASIATTDGDLVTGARLLGAAVALFEELGIKLDISEARLRAGIIDALEPRMDTEARARAMAEGRELPLDAAVDLALAGIR